MRSAILLWQAIPLRLFAPGVAQGTGVSGRNMVRRTDTPGLVVVHPKLRHHLTLLKTLLPGGADPRSN